MGGTADEEKEKLEAKKRLDAARLAEEKANLERIARQERSRQEALSFRASLMQKQQSSTQQSKEQARVEIAQRQDRAREEQQKNKALMSAQYIPEPFPKPTQEEQNAEPSWVKELRNKLSAEQNDAMKFDSAGNKLLFHGPQGLEAIKTLGVNFEGVGFNASNLQQGLRNIFATGGKDLLDKLVDIEVDGKFLGKDQLGKLKDAFLADPDHKITWPPKSGWPPKPPSPFDIPK